MIPPRQGGPFDKTLPTPDASYVQLIRGYGPGHFTIADRRWDGPVLVTEAKTVSWSVTRAEDLTLESVAALRDNAVPIEFLVVGCGPRPVFVPPPKRAAFKAAGLALEVVDTGAACRMFNVMVAEGRRVAAALVPLP